VALSIEDRMQIQDLYARYGRLVDSGDADGYVAIFTEDGAFRRTNPSPANAGGSGLPPAEFRGAAALHKLVLDLADLFKGKMRHQLTDLFIEQGPTPESASAVCYGLITDWREGAGRISMHATYRAQLVRTSGGWRFRDLSIERLPHE
jgi:SnoaL-like domain